MTYAVILALAIIAVIVLDVLFTAWISEVDG